MLILDQFQFFYAFTHNACKYIPSHVTDAMHQKLKHFFIVQKIDLITVCAKGRVIFPKNQTVFSKSF